MASKYEKLCEDCLAEDASEKKIPQVAVGAVRLRSRRSSYAVVAASVGLCGLLFLITFFLVHLTIARSTVDFIKFQQQLPQRDAGNNGAVQQHVHSSLRDNYVEYFVQVSPSERNWILDDFNTGLQVMKSESDGRSICFVTKLNITVAVAPSDVHTEYEPYKEHLFGVYTTEEQPVSDRAFLGVYARTLCRDANVYWMNPSTDVVHVTDMRDDESSDHMLGDESEEARDESEEASDESQMGDESEMGDDVYDNSVANLYNNGSAVHKRVKRRINQCRTSCCWLVCCCNTHHFTWETVEHFSCAHICDRCTPAYATRQRIQKVC